MYRLFFLPFCFFLYVTLYFIINKSRYHDPTPNSTPNLRLRSQSKVRPREVFPVLKQKTDTVIFLYFIGHVQFGSLKTPLFN